ncbi:hypothetical protein E7744_00875 [Citricoccus sp. SGAir0253]|uniref:hypothetical protein n=1 Tax=Citricoccus sp. SGAir0253 TaxID=2567881 RepID=UPI0010CCEEE5|nr:hypothetical protein [Citricoccus sp. SGAir0253]QCU76941.1 hypothetical protein E7744_00875 [Citricoccus sp. SGAir0253]
MLEDPHRFLDVMLSATDEAAALHALQERFDLDEEQGRVAINMQFRSMTDRTRRLIREEAHLLRD